MVRPEVARYHTYLAKTRRLPIGRLGRKHGEWFDRDCAFHVYTVLSKAMPSKVRIGWTP